MYRLPTKENKLPFSVPVCSKQTEVCRFNFLFAANKRKSPFSVSSIFCFSCSTKKRLKEIVSQKFKTFQTNLYEMYTVLSPKSRDPSL